MRILITGVAGFIGSNLANRLLEEGHYVIGIDNLSWGMIKRVSNKVVFYRADIRDKDIVRMFSKVDVVFHLAAKNCISDCQSDPVETADINTRGTINIFNACVKQNIKKVIYAESSSMYEGSDIFPSKEDYVNPQSFYAISKLTTSLFANAYHKYYGLNTTALRYFNVYGQGQDYNRTIPPLFSAIIIKLLKGEPPVIYGDGSKRRDFIHVDDVNDFHLLCMTDDRTDNEVYNIGRGVNYSVNEICDIISKELNIDIPPVYKDDLQGEALITLADISKANGVGWSPKITLEEGLKTSINYIKKEFE